MELREAKQKHEDVTQAAKRELSRLQQDAWAIEAKATKAETYKNIQNQAHKEARRRDEIATKQEEAKQLENN